MKKQQLMLANGWNLISIWKNAMAVTVVELLHDRHISGREHRIWLTRHWLLRRPIHICVEIELGIVRIDPKCFKNCYMSLIEGLRRSPTVTDRQINHLIKFIDSLQ